MERSKIDFERAAALMDVVQKVANVVPTFTALSGAAMTELKEMNDVAQKEANELGARRLKEEQERAAVLNAKAQDEADRQARQDAHEKAIDNNRQPVKPINVKPGEPNELAETENRLAAQHSEPEPRRI